MSKKTHHVDTLLAHAALKPDSNHGIPNPPIYFASTVLFPTVEEFEDRDSAPFAGVQYGRSGTPTQFALEEAVTALHGGHKTVSYPSGLGAIAGALLTFLKSGDHLLMVDSVYGPTRKRVCTNLLGRNGIEVEYYDPLIGDGIASLFRSNTKAVFMESPGSHTFEMQDVPAICETARDKGVMTMIDNTWSSPLFCQPLQLGVDVVIEAATKYTVGHSDAMLGTVTVATEDHFQALKTMANTLGTRAGPEECYMGLRGLRTLSVRLERHQKNTLAVAKWLQSRPEVDRVMYPALEDDPGHALWQRDHSGASGLFGMVFGACTQASVNEMVNGLELFGIGASWGGFESLVIPINPAKLRTATTWNNPNPAIRLHIGLADPDDLIADLELGLAKLKKI